MGKVFKLFSVVGAVSVAGLCAIASPVQAKDGEVGANWHLRATVPVACWVSQVGDMNAVDGAFGEVVEACNSPGGFQVSASYRQLSNLETAILSYGDAPVTLSKSGDQILRTSSMATIRKTQYRFEQVSLEAPLVLHLTIQPL